MKKLLLILVLLNFLQLSGMSQPISPVITLATDKETTSKAEPKANLRKIDHNAFKPGEKMEWAVKYGIVEAGIAKIEIIDEGRKVAGRKVYHIKGVGESRGAFDWFFKVRDRYETYIDADGVFPWMFVRRIDEGGYVSNQDYSFFQSKNQVDNGAGKILPTPEYVQDMVSAVYFARTMDLNNLQPGDVIELEAFVDNEVWPAKARYVGKETIKTKAGKIKCLKFNPILQKGRIFKNEADMTVYISDDENKIPVMVEAKIIVGSVKMELTKYDGLANPLAKVK
jgi:hypothetical protein